MSQSSQIIWSLPRHIGWVILGVVLLVAIALGVFAYSLWFFMLASYQTTEEINQEIERTALTINGQWQLNGGYSTTTGNSTKVFGGDPPFERDFLTGRIIEHHTSLLDLSGCTVSETDADIFARSRDCRFLSLKKVRASPAALQKLLTIRTIYILDLRGCPLADEHIVQLTRLPELDHIFLDTQTHSLAQQAQFSALAVKYGWDVDVDPAF